jgi:type III secretory pathway component EscU
MNSLNTWPYRNIPVYKSNFSKIEQQIKESDVLITDGTHRIVGLNFNEKDDSSKITVQCLRSEVAYAKQVAFSNQIRIITNDKLSAYFFHKYMTGDYIMAEDFQPVARIYAKLIRAGVVKYSRK